MREILFRGKSVDNGEWVYGYYVKLFSGKKNQHSHRIYTGFAEVDCGEYFPDCFEVSPKTVGQFTGLFDKNGKRIFEGDILAAPDYPNLKYKVSFANANFCVKCPAQPYLFYLGSRCFDMFGNPEYEIVGNIYDSDKEPFGNPEQLEVDE